MFASPDNVAADALGIGGSEASGMIFDPTNPYRCIVNGQHPANGTVPFLPPLRMSPFAPIAALVGGPVGQFQSVLPYGGSTTAIQVPGFLTSLSVMVQGVAVAGNGALVLTDGHEVVLR